MTLPTDQLFDLRNQMAEEKKYNVGIIMFL